MKRSFAIHLLAMGLLVSMFSGLAQAGTNSAAQTVVTTQSAPLMRGSTILGRLPAGYRLDVLRTAGPWLGTRATMNGRTVSGWVWQGHIAPPQVATRAPSVRRYSYAPALVPGAATPWRGPYPYATNTLPPDMRDYVTGGLRSGSPLIMGATRYGRNYWRADRKIIGY